jgi:hypothetical protein
MINPGQFNLLVHGRHMKIIVHMMHQPSNRRKDIIRLDSTHAPILWDVSLPHIVDGDGDG